METTRPMREAVIPAAVDCARLHRGMCRIETCPVSAEVAQMPLVIDEALFLLGRHLVVYELEYNTIVEDNGVFGVFLPCKAFLNLSIRL